MQMNSKSIAPDQIDVPECVERPMTRVDDDLLRKSIEEGGIQQPLVVIAQDDRYSLVDGLRRLRIARVLKTPRVPVVVDLLPAGVELQSYIARIRFILDTARQDLLPSQKADLIDQLKGEPFRMTHKQIAAYLGINPDSVTNWLSVKHYIEPVVKAVDFGHISLQSARVFDGLTEKGQKAIWKHHRDDLATQAGLTMHATLRELYSPQAYPQYYRQPDLTAERMSRKGGKRKAKSRPPMTGAEKRRLLSDLQMREVELREGQAELSDLKKRITASIAPIGAILRNEKLRKLVPNEMVEEFERFAEIHIP